jgi:hypothetical protein
VYHFLVIRRLYIHNFRCLENFELPIAAYSSALLIGKNGAGKTTVIAFEFPPGFKEIVEEESSGGVDYICAQLIPRVGLGKYIFGLAFRAKPAIGVLDGFKNQIGHILLCAPPY